MEPVGQAGEEAAVLFLLLVDLFALALDLDDFLVGLVLACFEGFWFDAGKKFSLLDIVSMENRLADILNMPVDLAPAKSLKDGVRERAIREAVLAFQGLRQMPAGHCGRN